MNDNFLHQDAELAKAGTRVLMEFARRLDARLITRGENEPYLWRGYLLGDDDDRKYNAFLHRFVASDDENFLHCHPWSESISFILAGTYRETSCVGRVPEALFEDPADAETMKVMSSPRTRIFGPGSTNVIMGDTFHRVELLTPEVWTLFIHGPRVQPWGFVEAGKYGVPLHMKVVKGKTSEARPPGNMVDGFMRGT